MVSLLFQNDIVISLICICVGVHSHAVHLGSIGPVGLSVLLWELQGGQPEEDTGKGGDCKGKWVVDSGQARASGLLVLPPVSSLPSSIPDLHT